MKYETYNKIVTASVIATISSIFLCLLAAVWGFPVVVIKVLITVLCVSLTTALSMMIKE